MPETQPILSAGLFIRDQAPTLVPLTGVTIEADIAGFCARVAVAHRYVNTETTPVEAVYVFPLDEGAAVCGFEAVVDGTLVVGEVQERDKAFEAYDEAMVQGHGAFLLDEERPDVFQASVGNLPPGKEVLLRLTYVTELSVDGSHLRFTIPTTVSPRYAPSEDHIGVGRSDSEALNPPLAWRVPYGLSLSVRVSMPSGITALESPSHPISIALHEGSATVTLGQRQVALDRDFVLSIEAAGTDGSQAWIERDADGRESVAVALVPSFPETLAPAEIIFVVDRSGSMEGASILEVRNALQSCLRSMVAGCRFNIIGFGSTYEALFPESRPYDQASLDAASIHIAGLQADLGGTELRPALEFALQQTRHAPLARQVVVLTDGQVTNTDAVLAFAGTYAADARLFTFGIGAGASHHLVRGLARAGGGSAEFIYPGERIEGKVVRLLGRLLSPALSEVSLEWVGGDVVQAPARVPPVFAGSRLLVYGLVKGSRPTSVRLSATSPSGPISFAVPLDQPWVGTSTTVTTLAARARIRELEESSGGQTSRGSRQTHKKQNSVTREIVELSTRYGLISRETSFVAIERRDLPLPADIQLRRVPVALTSGWAGVEDRVLLQRSHRRFAEAAAEVSFLGVHGKTRPAVRLLKLDSSAWYHRGTAALVGRDYEAAERQRQREHRHDRQRTAGRPDNLDALVLLQAADGSWDLTAELSTIAGHNLAELERALAGASGTPSNVRRAWATALALVWLRMHAGAWEDEWRLLAQKAAGWLNDVDAVPADRFTWSHAARQFLSASRAPLAAGC